MSEDGGGDARRRDDRGPASDDRAAAVTAAVVAELVRDAGGAVERDALVERAASHLDGVDRAAVAAAVSHRCRPDPTADGDVVVLRGGPEEAPSGSPPPGGGAPGVGSAGGGSDVTTVGEPTGERFGQLTVLADVGHEKVPDIAEGDYHERAATADKTDVQVVTKALQERMNVVLKGPPGVGKSYLAKYVCARTNRPLYRITLSEKTYREDLLGHLQLVATPEGDSVTSWVDGPLTRAAREGGILLLDEINAADANTAAALNAVMEQEETRSLTIPQTGEVVEPHSEFGVVATANPGYQGTYELNDAFEGRFRHVELDYLPAEVEVEVVFERTGLDRRKQSEVEELVTFAGELREAYVNGELQTPITTRELVRIATFMRTGFMDLETATRSELLARVDDHDEALVQTLIDKGL